MRVLETERLLLVPITKEHEDEIHRLHSDPLIVEALFHGKVPSREGTAEKVALYVRDWVKLGFGFFAVYRKSLAGGPSDLVGRSGLRYLADTTDVEFGHCFRGAVSGQGFASEAGQAIVSNAFAELGMDRIVSVVRPENARGLRAVSNVGLRYVGDRWHYGRLMKYFEVTAEDWQIQRAYAQSRAPENPPGLSPIVPIRD
jgi:[ribosomal protein S5]-alanine N-acetyltransferase